MSANYMQDGTTLDYQNTGAGKLLSGQPVAVGGITGVAHDDIAPGEFGTLHTAGVFWLPKAAEAIALGQKVYVADGKITAAAGATETPNALAGSAWDAAAAEDEVVPVRLGY